MATTRTITNPIRPGFFPDPSIVRVGDDYYMVNSSFLYFPCVPISHSRDLVHWEIIGHAVSNPDYIDLSPYDPGKGFWAPDISYTNGRFYIAVTLRGNDTWEMTHRQMIVWSEKPEGPYSEPVYIDTKGIDPSLFHDDDGRHYMIHNLGAQIVELSDDCLHAITPSRMLCEGCTRIKTEGSHLLKKDGWYYLFMSEGGTGDGHMITCARARSLNEEFEMCPHNPLITQTDHSAALQRTGHGKPFIGPDGEWYIIFLCGRKRGGNYSLLGRETAIGKITWDKDGWPHINEGRGPQVEISVGYDIEVVEKKPFTVNFSGDFTSPDLIHYGSLTLKRQTSIDCNVTLELKSLCSLKDECGLIFYYDVNSYIKFGVKETAGTRSLFVNVMNRLESDTEMTVRETSLCMGEDKLTLSIDTFGLKKDFLYKDGSALQPFVSLDDCKLLTDEGLSLGKRFTGPVVGVFGLDENRDCMGTFTLRDL